MDQDVRKTDVNKTYMVSLADGAEILTTPPVIFAESIGELPRKRGTYQRLRMALSLFGLGKFEFERERDDRA